MNNFNECGFGGGNDCLWIILLMLCCGGCKSSCGCGGCNDCGCK